MLNPTTCCNHQNDNHHQSHHLENLDKGFVYYCAILVIVQNHRQIIYRFIIHPVIFTTTPRESILEKDDANRQLTDKQQSYLESSQIKH